MGMFDYVTYGDRTYQTKSLHNEMANYQIEDGVLLKEQAKYEWRESGSIFGGMLEKVSSQWVPQHQYSGQIEFYRHLDKTYKVWEELIAFVIDGKIVKVVNKLEQQ